MPTIKEALWSLAAVFALWAAVWFAYRGGPSDAEMRIRASYPLTR